MLRQADLSLRFWTMFDCLLELVKIATLFHCQWKNAPLHSNLFVLVVEIFPSLTCRADAAGLHFPTSNCWAAVHSQDMCTHQSRRDHAPMHQEQRGQVWSGFRRKGSTEITVVWWRAGLATSVGCRCRRWWLLRLTWCKEHKLVLLLFIFVQGFQMRKNDWIYKW